jgi:ATP-dependent Clp protease ATP-binding subunit ClpA
VLVTYQAIEEIVKLADQFITDMPMPEKALDVLEEVLVYWGQNSKNQFVLKEDVDKVFSDKTKIPVGEIGSGEQQKLMNLESVLKQRVIGQDEVIKQISQMMLRARSGISDRSKPIGSFLFMGPTGVGKTETAKALAEAYFGDENKMIRLDMSEYQRPEAVKSILGQPELGTHSKFLSAISENPFSVVLFDEIEKAYHEILNLFLQILDEGWITDAFGKKIIFKNSIIIATSNVGSEIIKDGIESGYGNETIHKHVIDYAISKGVFAPEFLNRFERVLFFRSLEGDQLREVTRLMIEKVTERIFKNKNIRMKINEDVAEKIIEKGYDPIFGARSIKRFIQDRIEDVIAKKIIEGSVAEGQEVELKAEDI